MNEYLSDAEKKVLLHLARQALECSVRRQKFPDVDSSTLTPLLCANGASFVTLSIHGQLRGCIGALQPYQPLFLDVCEHAVAAALEDYRFPQVQPDELEHIHVEISRLTMPQTLSYENPEDLLKKLRPGIDGVILKDGPHRATFLPQVWAQLANKEEFLSHLCAKMGANANIWRYKHLEVETYQVEEFHENR